MRTLQQEAEAQASLSRLTLGNENKGLARLAEVHELEGGGEAEPGGHNGRKIPEQVQKLCAAFCVG